MLNFSYRTKSSEEWEVWELQPNFYFYLLLLNIFASKSCIIFLLIRGNNWKERKLDLASLQHLHILFHYLQKINNSFLVPSTSCSFLQSTSTCCVMQSSFACREITSPAPEEPHPSPFCLILASQGVQD